MTAPVLVVAGPPASELEAALLREAIKWAHEVGDARVVTGEVAEAARELAGGGPLFVVWPELPVLRRELAAAALDDLASGCEVVLGPLFAGGLYLLAMTRTTLPVLRADWTTEDALGRGFALAAGAGSEVGLLRTERGLRQPSDVRAALADPCLPPELRAVLERAGTSME